MMAAARKLPREQAWLLFELAHDARWEAGSVNVRGAAIALDVGELLTSLDGLSEKHGLSVDQVRRALATFERLGIISRRKAATQAATSPAAEAATPAKDRPATEGTQDAERRARLERAFARGVDAARARERIGRLNTWCRRPR